MCLSKSLIRTGRIHGTPLQHLAHRRCLRHLYLMLPYQPVPFTLDHVAQPDPIDTARLVFEADTPLCTIC